MSVQDMLHLALISKQELKVLHIEEDLVSNAKELSKTTKSSLGRMKKP